MRYRDRAMVDGALDLDGLAGPGEVAIFPVRPSTENVDAFLWQRDRWDYDHRSALRGAQGEGPGSAVRALRVQDRGPSRLSAG